MNFLEAMVLSCLHLSLWSSLSLFTSQYSYHNVFKFSSLVSLHLPVFLLSEYIQIFFPSPFTFQYSYYNLFQFSSPISLRLPIFLSQCVLVFFPCLFLPPNALITMYSSFFLMTCLKCGWSTFDVSPVPPCIDVFQYLCITQSVSMHEFLDMR